jgi:hypothetical protein
VGESGFFYVDAVTDQVIGPLTDGLTINLGELPSPPPNLNIVYRPPGCAQSVAFTLDGDATDVSDLVTGDNAAPFSLFGDVDGDYNADTLTTDTYTLIATPFSGTDASGVATAPDTVRFSVVSAPQATGPYVAHYTLINAGTEQAITEWDPIPEGSTLDMATLPAQLNIRANLVDPDTLVESVRFFLSVDGQDAFIGATGHRTEKARPYSVFSDYNQAIQGNDLTIDVDPPNNTNYSDWTPTKNAVRRDGAYALMGIPYSTNAPADGIAYGPKTLNFTVVNAPPQPSARLAEDGVALAANFPNPFNPATTIEFSLEAPAQVRLLVYDLLGREVQRLLDAPLEAGVHQVRFEAGDLPSGTYFYRIETPQSSLVRRMTLLK